MKLYKLEITKFPKTHMSSYTATWTYEDGDIGESLQVSKHLTDPVLRAEWEASELAWKEENFGFYLPSETKIFRSRTSVRDRIKAVERWGGEARCLVAEVGEFEPVEVAKKRRADAVKRDRIRKLQDEIDRLKEEILPTQEGTA